MYPFTGKGSVMGNFGMESAWGTGKDPSRHTRSEVHDSPPSGLHNLLAACDRRYLLWWGSLRRAPSAQA